MTKLKADWLAWPFLKDIVSALGPENIRFVGGVVRDTLVRRDIKDIDAATRYLPEETKTRLEACGIKVIPTGLEHGTVTAVRDGQTVEITTLRHDVETDGRHAKVAFTDDWLEDAKRRDFTMNALYLAADGTLFDPFGGEAAARAGQVCFIGDPEKRIEEDALRILRFFRFHAHYGKGDLDAEGLRAVTVKVALLEQLSAERVRDEICKILAAPDPMPSLRAMTEADVWAHTPVVGADLQALEALLAAEEILGFDPDILMRFAAITGTRACSAARVLRMSNRQMKTLKAIRHGFDSGAPADAKSMRAFLYWYGPEAGQAAVLAHTEAQGEDVLQVLASWEIPELPVRGQDLIILGMKPSPEISQKLKQIEERWVESDFSLSKEVLLAPLKNVS